MSLGRLCFRRCPLGPSVTQQPWATTATDTTAVLQQLCSLWTSPATPDQLTDPDRTANSCSVYQTKRSLKREALKLLWLYRLQCLCGLNRYLPQSFQPYAQLMRLDKFSATWLLAWPCFWSIGMAAPTGELPDLQMLALFGTGAVIMRSAGCTVNDLWDVDLDRLVFRTKQRPLAASKLNQQQAMTSLAVQLTAGLAVLLQLNDYSKILGASSLALVVSYPLMKRFTYWPQLFLGATINWGALLGWSAVHGSCNWAVVLPLYTSGIFWTLIYDTIYACQDRRDDMEIGVKSTALYFGDEVKTWLTGFAVCQLACLWTSGYASGCGSLYFASVFATGCHLAWQISTVQLSHPDDCMRKFASNKWLGSILFSGIILDKLMA